MGHYQGRAESGDTGDRKFKSSGDQTISSKKEDFFFFSGNDAIHQVAFIKLQLLLKTKHPRNAGVFHYLNKNNNYFDYGSTKLCSVISYSNFRPMQKQSLLIE
jgi:hypothetical protein